MKILTEDARVRCAHINGIVALAPSQTLVTIAGRRVLVEGNPEGKAIRGCPNAAPPFRPCLTTLHVEEGYSTLVQINGQRVCLDTVTGKTDGTPPGVVYYKVHEPGQTLVEQR